ncbi:MAG: phenylacetate--CoA ligase family protein [Rhodoferax sp.]|nr:phenylacetate--CoA ligase family protein [Rhodoferax sp.]
MTPLFDPLFFSAVALDVLACARFSPEAIEVRQRFRLAKLVGAAARGSLLYSERLPKSPELLPLRALPIIDKRELMDRFDDWVVDSRLNLADLRTFVAQPQRIAEPYLNTYLVWESSGTGHQPGLFVQDARALAVYDALEALRRSVPRVVQRWMDPLLVTERIAFVGAIGGHFASVVSMQRLCRASPWLAHSFRFFSILEPMDVLMAQLNEFAPTVLATYPTMAVLIADAAARGALRCRPKEVWCGGETLSCSARHRVESALDCTLLNSYGASEFLSIGWECRHGQMHANTDWLILEPIDERGRPTPPGEASHSTLLTNLANHVQPLIRYDLGDQIMIHPDPCACGVTLPVITVKGRRDDPLIMDGRGAQVVTLLPLALTTVLEDEAGVFDFQLCQRDARTLVLRLSLFGAQGEDAADRCRKALLSFAEVQGLAPISILIELGQDLPRGNSGKAQRIVAMRP